MGVAAWLLNPVTVIVTAGLMAMAVVVLIVAAAAHREPEEYRRMDRAFHAYQRQHVSQQQARVSRSRRGRRSPPAGPPTW